MFFLKLALISPLCFTYLKDKLKSGIFLLFTWKESISKKDLPIIPFTSDVSSKWILVYSKWNSYLHIFSVSFFRIPTKLNPSLLSSGFQLTTFLGFQCVPPSRLSRILLCSLLHFGLLIFRFQFATLNLNLSKLEKLVNNRWSLPNAYYWVYCINIIICYKD